MTTRRQLAARFGLPWLWRREAVARRAGDAEALRVAVLGVNREHARLCDAATDRDALRGWKASGLRALSESNFDAWAEKCLAPARAAPPS